VRSRSKRCSPAHHERVVQQLDVELVIVHARHFQSHHQAPFFLEHVAASIEQPCDGR
jgi:hypothetical protein